MQFNKPGLTPENEMAVGSETPAYYLQPLPVADSTPGVERAAEAVGLQEWDGMMLWPVSHWHASQPWAPASVPLPCWKLLSICVISEKSPSKGPKYIHITSAFADSRHTNLYNPSITQRAFTSYPLKAFFTFSLIHLYHTNAACKPSHSPVWGTLLCSFHYHQHLVTTGKGRSWATLDLQAVQPSAQNCTVLRSRDLRT